MKNALPLDMPPSRPRMDPRQSSLFDRAVMGSRFRSRRRAANSKALDTLVARIERAILNEETALSLQSVLLREIASDGTHFIGIDDAEHPDWDRWQDLLSWAQDNGLNIFLRQKAHAVTGEAHIDVLPAPT